jgi:biotin carboxyl carrier protein
MARGRAPRITALKLRIEVDGESHLLDSAAIAAASIEEVRPGVFSILLGARSFMVNVAVRADEFEVVSSDGLPRIISVADTRDLRGAADAASSKGPATIRAQMPGKIVKLLVQTGAQVEAGQGLIVVEAMKMQNEVKAPKSGIVMKIQAAEGATVGAGETLMVVE